MFLKQSQKDFRETRNVFFYICLVKVIKEHGKSLKDKIDLIYKLRQNLLRNVLPALRMHTNK